MLFYGHTDRVNIKVTVCLYHLLDKTLDTLAGDIDFVVRQRFNRLHAITFIKQCLGLDSFGPTDQLVLLLSLHKKS
jgi:hypothetical protein